MIKISPRTFDTVLVVLFLAFMCLYRTGAGSFRNGDQTSHSIVVQSMVQEGHFLRPRIDDHPYYNKPPFKMWLATIPVFLFGENNFSYRVVDGLCGIALGTLVFFFALNLFGSRAVAYFSLFSLTACRLLFYGHGIRNAVQDSCMLLLMSIGAVVGWYILDEVRKSGDGALNDISRRKIWKLAIWGGVAIGLGALTKNVPAYYAYVIVGLTALFSGDAIRVLKKIPVQLLVSVLISIGILGLYILAQGDRADNAFQQLVLTEVFKRATKGYHFVKKDWYYVHWIFVFRAAVAPELLVPAILYGLHQSVRRFDRRFIFLLCWAVIPVICQSLMKSKLEWYILPALPGMAILTGVLLGKCFDFVYREFITWRTSSVRPTWRVALPATALVLCGFVSLTNQNYKVAKTFMSEVKRVEVDEMVQDLKRFSKKQKQPLNVVKFSAPFLTTYETLYFNMLFPEKVREKGYNRLLTSIKEGKVDIVITERVNFERIARAGKVYAYAFLAPDSRRREILSVIVFKEELLKKLPRHLVPSKRNFEFAFNKSLLAYGWGAAGGVHGTSMRLSAGRESAVLIDTHYPHKFFPSTVEFSVASTVPLVNGEGLKLKMLLNGKPLTEFWNIPEGFNPLRMTIPPYTWEIGTNLLQFQYELPGKKEIKTEDTVLFLKSLDFEVNSSN